MPDITYGYVRVSTQEQNEARQLTAMKEFGIKEENIVVEKKSGKDFHRPCYQRLIRKLQPRDVLVVKSIDRLGRNYNEILEQWSVITKKKKAAIVVLQLLSYVAQTERENIRQRQAEGIAAAKAKGVHFGKRARVLPDNFEKTRQAWRNSQISLREAARVCGIPKSTFRDAVLRAETIMRCAGTK